MALLTGSVLLIAVVLAAELGPEARAKLEFDAAEDLYDAGDYAEAMVHYERAHVLIPLPEFLFNIGQCHRNLGDYKQAVDFLRRYLDEATDVPDVARLETLIADLEAQIQKPADPPPEGPVTEPAPATKLDLGPTVVDPPQSTDLGVIPLSTEVGAAPKAVDVVAAPPEDAQPGLHERWWFWTLVGVVVIGGAAGAVVAATATSPPEGSLGTFDYR